MLYSVNHFPGLLATLLILCGSANAGEGRQSHPNIVYILADDLGYGDVRAVNPEGKIKTPNIDRLANEGMRFTDMHSGSAVCTPTRYGLLTGRYAWRTRLQQGVCWGYSAPLISRQRLTVASLLKQRGYKTACVGKWHLGLKWGLAEEDKIPRDSPAETSANIDFTRPISSGPLQLGFDYFYGIPASLDMEPYVYIENDRVTTLPTKIVEASAGKKFWRRGPVGSDFRHIEVLDRLTEKAVQFIGSQSKSTPFFLYFPLPAPHKPILPTPKFQGKSGLNEWGDFVMQVDATVGTIMKSLSTHGFADNTLLIVTSDNGATPGADFDTLKGKGHNPSFIFRGHKADIFEGGHRVPFIARWPGVIDGRTTTAETTCLTDLMATVAEITGFEIPVDAAEDSVSMLPLMRREARKTTRAAIVHHSVNGSFAVRQGKWKLILCPGSGGWSLPRPPEARKQNLPKVQLYDLSRDLGEQTNLSDHKSEVVNRLTALLQRYVDEGRSTPGPSQKNARPVNLFK